MSEKVVFSSDKENWHDTYIDGDEYGTISVDGWIFPILYLEDFIPLFTEIQGLAESDTTIEWVQDQVTTFGKEYLFTDLCITVATQYVYDRLKHAANLV